MKQVNKRTRLIVIGAIVLLLGYGLWWLGVPKPTIHILDARLQTLVTDKSILSIQIYTNDVRKIMNRQYYTHVYVNQCKSTQDYFPTYLSYNGIDFNNVHGMKIEIAKNVGKTIDLSVEIPDIIQDDYSDACLRLGGGQMLGIGGPFNSNEVRIVGWPKQEIRVVP